jgi:hypothetical protein
MAPENLRIEEVTDTNLVHELAELFDTTLRPDSIYEFFSTYAPSTVYEGAFERIKDAVVSPDSRVFRAMLTVTNEDGSTKDVLAGMSQWQIGYIVLPKVDPFAPKSKAAEDDQVADVANVAIPDQHGVATPLPAPKEQSEQATSNVFEDFMRIAGNAYVSSIRGKRHICEYFGCCCRTVTDTVSTSDG